MTTIVNTPAVTSEREDNSLMSFLIGIIVVVSFVGLLFYVGIPAINRLQPAQITLPAPQIVMPDKVDVNVQQAK